MAKCAQCGKTILFRGRAWEGKQLCGDECLRICSLVHVAARLPEGAVRERARQVHAGGCSKCGRRQSPVGVYTSHRVYSILLLTRWWSVSQVSCRRCGMKSMATSAAYSMLLGWWGFPWGLLMTPVQIVKNAWAMAQAKEETAPTPALEGKVRFMLAEQSLQQQQAEPG